MGNKKTRLGANPLDWIKSTAPEEATEENMKTQSPKEKNAKQPHNKPKSTVPVSKNIGKSKENKPIKTNQQSPKLKSNTATPNQSKKENNKTSFNPYQLVYFKDYWTKQPNKTPEINTEFTQSESILLLDTDEHLFNTLKTRLPGSQITLVRPGKMFHEIEHNSFEITPVNSNHYNQLFEKLLQRGSLPTHLIHLWSKQFYPVSTNNIKEKLQTGIYTLFHLTQEYLNQKTGRNIRLLYLYTSPKGEINPAEAAMGSFNRTLGLENPHFIYKILKLEVTQQNQGEINRVICENLEQILTLLKSDDGEVEIRQEENEIYIKRLKPLNISKQIESNGLWKEKGVYLITGGAGGLGKILTRYLATQYKARLILTGRSGKNKDIEALIKELETSGAEVTYIQSDVSNIRNIEILRKEIKLKYGHLNGIIHSAGVIRDAFLLKKTMQQVEEVLASKIYGTLNLDDVFKEDQLDFFIFFSSLTSIIGNPGQSDYAYANGYMDYFSQKRELLRQLGQRWGRSISVNWPLWQEGGMKITQQDLETAGQQSGIQNLPSEIGIEALEYITRHQLPISTCQVFYGDPEKIIEKVTTGYTLKIPAEDKSVTTPSAPQSDVEPTLLFEKTQGYLKKVLADILKLPENQLEPKTPFERYGIDSIIIKMFNTRIEKELFPINKTLLFEYQLLEELTQYFVKQHPQQLIHFFHLEKKPSSTDKQEPQTVSPQSPMEKSWPKLIPLENKYPHLRKRTDRYQSLSGNRQEDIAIIGVSGRYPQARNINEYWENLKQGKDSISEIPINRWDNREFYSPEPGKGKIYTKWGGFIDDVEMFDPLLFNISPREAKTMDPQDRLFLETVWELLEEAGYSKRELAQMSQDPAAPEIGVFVGVTSYLYHLLATGMNQALSLPQPWSLANRVSFLFNFHGPSMPIDTACSSSLTALHLACESLKRGECRIAVVGGVNLYLHPAKYIGMCSMKMLSATGRCHTFGAKSDGFIPGEGVGALLLKPLPDAIQDNDHIYALIKGSSINHGGRTNGYTVPNPAAQAKLIIQALKNANVHPRTISYIEAHGTGTILGDPIEIEGLTQAFKKYTSENQFCSIGSVKSNIGHLESAAGVAGITKLLLQFKHKQLAPTLLNEPVNPNIDFQNSPFYIQRELSEWKPSVTREQGKEKENPRRAGISSFGAGGTNVHVVLEEYIEPPTGIKINSISSNPSQNQHIQPSKESTTNHLILISARDRERLKEYIQKIIEFLEEKDLQKTETQPLEKIEKDIIKITADILNVHEDNIDIQEEILTLGFNPVTSLELVQQINALYGIELTPLLVAGTPTLKSLATQVFESSFKDSGLSIETQPQANKHSLYNIAYTLQTGREHMEQRIAVICSEVRELQQKLNTYLQEPSGKEIIDVYSGNIKTDKSLPADLFKGKAGEEHLRTLLKERELIQLAQLWVRGIEIDWHQLYTYPQPRRESLPTYPFAKEHCWINEINSHSYTEIPMQQIHGTSSSLHPLIDGIHPQLSLGQGLVFQKQFHKEDVIMKDHRVNGNMILPGVGYLEMALAAITHAIKSKRYDIHRVLWLQPLKLENNKKDAQVIIKTNQNKNYEFEIQGKDKSNDRMICHARGEFKLHDDEKSLQKNSAHYSIEKIKSVCNHRIEKEKIYQWYQQLGVTYGPYFQTLEYIDINETTREALGKLSLPPRYREELSQFTLHPAMMDGALQTIIGVAVNVTLKPHEQKTAMLPYAMEKIEIYHPLKSQMVVYVKPSAPKTPQAATGEMKTFDVILMDETGNPCIVISEITFRQIKQLPAENHQSTEKKLENYYFQPVWTKSTKPITHENEPRNKEKSTVLIIYNEDGQQLGNQLARLHNQQQDNVIHLLLGTQTHIEAGDHWQIDVNSPESYQHPISNQPGIDIIYFLGGINSHEPKMNSKDILKDVEESQQLGVRSLYRLVKALNNTGYSQKSLQLTVITNDVYSINNSEILNPYSGSLSGFMLSVAKEFSQWQTVNLDISLKEINSGDTDKKEANLKALVARILQKPSVEMGEIAVLRSGVRYVQRLQQVRLPEVHQSQFKPRGVYLILGGTGGIGLEFSRYLAKNVNARLVLIDRKPIQSKQEEIITEIKNLGGEVLYIQADACHEDSMKKAIDNAIKHYGQINGVIHSAIVLKDKSLDQMDEETLNAALEPKVRGTVVLYNVIKELPLDFILFFSAAQSFVGNAGQSNYAAGCTFKDAYALYLSQKTKHTIKIINWGYWGTVGIVATGYYQQKLTTQGVYSITPQEGMEAIERLLNNSLQRLAPLKAEGKIMDRLLLDSNHYIEFFPTQIPSVYPKINDHFIQPVKESEIQQLEDGYRQLNRYSHLLLLGIFQQMGMFQQANQHYKITEMQRQLGISPTYKRLFNALIDILVRAGMLQRQPGEEKIETSELLENQEITDALRSLEEIKSQLIETHPDLAAHIRLLTTCLSAYPAILRGEVSAQDVMFPHSQMELVEGIYKGNTRADYFNQLTAQVAETYIREQYIQLKPGEKITLCEIGAGTGGTSTFVLKALQQYKDRISYIYTDISPAFTRLGKKQFYGANPFMEFRQLDIESDVERQGNPPGTIDLVIAANVLHATANIRETLRNIKKLLKTNGIVILNEVTGIHDFATLTFGLLKGWWLYTDEDSRIQDSPLLEAAMWENIFKEEGYPNVKSIGDQSAEKSAEIPSNHIIIAESNGQVSKTNRETSITPEKLKTNTLEIPQVTPRVFTPKQKQELDLPVIIEQAIIESLAGVLQINRKEFDKETSYLDFGVDSILAVEIINLINSRLQIQLRTTDLFNFPTIRSLSEHIMTEFGKDLQMPGIQPEQPPEETYFILEDDQSTQEIDFEIDSNSTEDSNHDPILEILNRMKNGELDINTVHDLLELEVYDEA